ncbi:hypothetical protein FH972_023094 [Carpinus fangiana]|uniref:Uncharacterized protein n=1 Tax=Carpinus fangiana TaxID=176857 RepID=A0A5N6KUF5_9ROSI|nr:hypothetical protein FH972_023094 [Carpinus fangiana]
MKVRNVVAILVALALLAARIRVHYLLRDERNAREHSAVPLDEMLEGVALGALEAVAAVQRVEPAVKEEPGPLAALDQHRVLAEALVVLREDKLNAVVVARLERVDDAVRGHHRHVGDHEVLEARLGGDVGVDGEVWAHEERMLVKVKEPCAVREERHGVAEGGDFGPADGGFVEVVTKTTGGVPRGMLSPPTACRSRDIKSITPITAASGHAYTRNRLRRGIKAVDCAGRGP